MDYQFHPQTKKDLLVKLKQKQFNHEQTLHDEKALLNIRSNIPYMSSLSLFGGSGLLVNYYKKMFEF